MDPERQKEFFAGLEETDALGQGKQMSKEDAALVRAYAGEMEQLTTAREEAAAPYNQSDFGTGASRTDAELAAERKDFAAMSPEEVKKVAADPKVTVDPKQTGQGITFEKGGYGSRDNLLEPKTGKQATI